MPKQNVMDAETAYEAAQKAMDTALEAQEKAEETFRQALEDLFEAAGSTLRQTRQTALTLQAGVPAMAALKPATEAILEAQDKALDTWRLASKTSFDNYRRTVAEPMRRLARESAAKLSPKARA